MAGGNQVIRENEEEPEMNVTRVGVDIAKNVFHVRIRPVSTVVDGPS